MTLTPGKKDLYRLKEVNIVDPFLSLRDSFPHLKAALLVVEAVDKFLPQEIPKAHLFDLLAAYLGKLGSAKNPENFYYSFVLKMVHVEGFLDVEGVPPGVLPLLATRRWQEIDTLNFETKMTFYFSKKGSFARIPCTPLSESGEIGRRTTLRW